MSVILDLLKKRGWNLWHSGHVQRKDLPIKFHANVINGSEVIRGTQTDRRTKWRFYNSLSFLRKVGQKTHYFFIPHWLLRVPHAISFSVSQFLNTANECTYWFLLVRRINGCSFPKHQSRLSFVTRDAVCILVGRKLILKCSDVLVPEKVKCIPSTDYFSSIFNICLLRTEDFNVLSFCHGTQKTQQFITS
jgi:hypothetical protein